VNSLEKGFSNFGEFIAKKREEKEITLRKMAELIGFSAPFWSDVEKDRRNPPDKDKLLLISNVFQMSEDETAYMFDLAGKKRDSVAPDLPDYINQRGYVSTALRKARDLGASEDDCLNSSKTWKSERSNF
jgi:transcriptional regulator with XRE-family HTH domain